MGSSKRLTLLVVISEAAFSMELLVKDDI